MSVAVENNNERHIVRRKREAHPYPRHGGKRRSTTTESTSDTQKSTTESQVEKLRKKRQTEDSEDELNKLKIFFNKMVDAVAGMVKKVKELATSQGADGTIPTNSDLAWLNEWFFSFNQSILILKLFGLGN